MFKLSEDDRMLKEFSERFRFFGNEEPVLVHVDATLDGAQPRRVLTD